MSSWTDLPVLQGKRALVVGGGGGGIGSAISAAIADAGADIAVVDIDPGRARAAARDLARPGHDALGIVADILQPDQVRRLVEEARSGLGGIDVLVTVVGGQTVFGLPFVPLHEYSEEQVARSLGLNLGYVLDLLRAAVPVMLEQGSGGSIVSVGSISGGPNGAANQAVYGASKSAVSHLSRSISAEYGYAGIRMNVVSPGSIRTPATGQRERGEVDAVLQRVPLGRRGEPAEIADAVVFFASDLSRYVAGQTLAVDGGATACHPLPHASTMRPLAGAAQ